MKGKFPIFIPKTNQERVQNLVKEFSEWVSCRYHWEVTEKADGASMTVYLKDNDFGVCSRNLELKYDDINIYCRIALRDRMKDILLDYGRNIALQGELIGAGINGNLYRMMDNKFLLFDIFDIDRGVYFDSVERNAFADRYGIWHVSCIDKEYVFSGADIDFVLNYAEGGIYY